MSKLFKLKKWLLLKDAADYLSVALSEPVKESDILQLALDGQITLSVNVSQQMYCKRARVLSGANVRRAQGIPIKGMPPYEVILGIRVGEDSFLDFHDAVVQSCEGIFDLPMVGGERTFVQDKFQHLTGGMIVETTNIDGVFLQEPPSEKFGTGDFFQVVDYIERTLDWRDLSWYPVGNLPEHVVLVVRTQSLNNFLKSVETGTLEESVAARPLAPRERSALLRVIGGLVELLLDSRATKAKTQNASDVIAALVAAYGDKEGISKRNLEGKFAEAKQLLDRT